MTFFLARMAGISYEDAYTIALGTQYIDENPDTWPMDPNNLSGNILDEDARNRLASYHFTTTPSDYLAGGDYDQQRTALEQAYHIASGGGDLQSYTDWRYFYPQNPQLTLLKNTVINAPTKCAHAQFFGEYLHAFEDTFGHRDQNNVPIPLNLGFGHGTYGHSPDKTYNHTVTLAELASKPGLEKFAFKEVGDWNQNEARTYNMEGELFLAMRQYNTGADAINPKTGKPVIFKDFASFLQDWNKLQSTTDKVAELNAKLTEFGLGTIPDFNLACAAAKRRAYIGGLNPTQFEGAILSSSSGLLSDVKKACGA
jgi:hypothetical protein